MKYVSTGYFDQFDHKIHVTDNYYEYIKRYTKLKIKCEVQNKGCNNNEISGKNNNTKLEAILQKTDFL